MGVIPEGKQRDGSVLPTDLSFSQCLNLKSLIKMGYKQAKIGLMPEDWHLKPIYAFAEIRGRVGWKGYTKKDLVEYGPYTIGAKHIDKSNRLDLSDPTFLSKQKYFESPEIMVHLGDILLVQRGSIGKLALVNRAIGEATINPSMVIIRTRSVSPGFVTYYLMSKSGQAQILSDTSITGVPMLSQKQIENFIVPLPPTKAEQEAIAAALSDADALIESLEQLIAKKRQVKQGAMQELLTGKRRLPGFEIEPGFRQSEAGQLPKDWIVKSIAEIAPLQRGFDLPTNQLQEGLYPVAYSNGVLNFHNKAMVKAPGVVTGRSGTLGKVHFLDSDYWPHNTTLWVTRFNSNWPKFVYYLYTSIGFERFGSGTGVPTLNRNDAHSFQVAIPPTTDEQKAIATALSDIDADIEGLEVKLTKANLLKQGMMQELLTGRIRLV